ncbi:hypothetical protein A0H81_02266 [Grifola frondosa]|uniref:Uncharacterized protein n=1 Tax=Grifola frondosa TaxID=5627 RepID=A0A1C7MN80_GRIFR|nr:hypothetical protein A0H81_02266 [Grifola frondosa]
MFPIVTKLDAHLQTFEALLHIKSSSFAVSFSPSSPVTSPYVHYRVSSLSPLSSSPSNVSSTSSQHLFKFLLLLAFHHPYTAYPSPDTSSRALMPSQAQKSDSSASSTKSMIAPPAHCPPQSILRSLLSPQAKSLANLSIHPSMSNQRAQESQAK